MSPPELLALIALLELLHELRSTDLMDSCSSYTNLNQSTSTIYVSPVLKSIDHVSGSHITVVIKRRDCPVR